MKQRSKIERLLHRDGYDTIGDFHDMSSANTQMYLNKGIPHLNVLKLVEYIHEVWEAHRQEKVADLEPPPTPKASDASRGETFSNEVEDAHTNERGSIMTQNEREEAARPTPMRCNSSALRREIVKAELKKVLASEEMGELTDALWDMGIRRSRQLADIEWEDVSEARMSRVQFKVLQRIGREHSAPKSEAPPSAGSSASSALAPPTPGYETAKRWNALPPAAGDVEMQPTKTTTDETVGVDLPTPHNGDGLELQETALPPPVPPQSTGEQPPGMEASRLLRMASAFLGDGAGKEAADAPLADRALTTINRSQSAQL